MSFDVDHFVANPSKTELYGFTKPQLKQVIGKIGLDYDTSAKNTELQQTFVEENLILEELISTCNSEIGI